ELELKFYTTELEAGTAALHEIQFVQHSTIRVDVGPAPGGLYVVSLTYSPITGKNFVVEFRDDLGPSGAWQALSGGLDNSGRVGETSTASQRFYRLRISDP